VKFQKTYDAVMSFRSLVKVPRDRLIAHADKDAAVRDDGLGGYHPSEERQFFADLQDFSDQASALIGLPSLKLSPQAPHKGGVECLLKALGRGIDSKR
jgi:hypothetical protein